MGPERILVNLRAVTFIDSTGLSALVHGWRAASQRGVGFSVAEPAPQVRRVMEITNLERLFETPEA
jgi:anti-sigma B factor antagonist